MKEEEEEGKNVYSPSRLDAVHSDLCGKTSLHLSLTLSYKEREADNFISGERL
jgi:hypothetical protein